jgi:hypothetical protein
MKMKCAQRPPQGSFTVGNDYSLRFKSDDGGGYVVKDDKGHDVNIPNSMCFRCVSKSGKVSPPAKNIPRGMSYIPVVPKKGKDEDE